jgi:hypothetical protein
LSKTKSLGYLAIVLLVSSAIVLSLPSVSDVASALTPEDLEFWEWYTTTMNRIEADAIAMATAIEEYNCTGVETGARSGYEAATTALDEIEGYEVSSEMQPVKNQLKLAVEEFKVACNHAEVGAMKYDPDELATAARYVNSSATHLEEIDELGLVSPAPVEALKRLQVDLEHAVQILGGSKTPSPSPTPTPEAPGYDAIFAVGSLLAVAYLVLRRRR